MTRVTYEGGNWRIFITAKETTKSIISVKPHIKRGREMCCCSRSKWIEKKQICQRSDHKICLPSTPTKEPEIKSKPNERMSFIH